jgi:hypothetical protein
MDMSVSPMEEAMDFPDLNDNEDGSDLTDESFEFI